MARLENAVKSIGDVFLEYADGDGKLNKEELMKLLEKEIENPEIKAKLSKVGVDKAMGRDKNSDGELNFREFSRFVCFMSKCYYRKMAGKGEECDDECE